MKTSRCSFTVRVYLCVRICVCMHAHVLSCFSHIQFCATSWTVACQASLSMGFSRQECWDGLQCPPPGDLPNPGIEPTSLTYPALAGRFFTTSATWEALQRQPACVLSCFSRVRLCATLWTVAYQAPLSMGFSRQETWGGLRALLQGIFHPRGLLCINSLIYKIRPRIILGCCEN